MSASSASGPVPMPVDVVSDVVCPWCFVGKRRFEKAVALVPEIPLTVRWRPYFLNPWVPRAGISRAEYLTTKFGSVEKYETAAQRIVEAAEAEGLVYALRKIARQPNTIDCHRLIRWAGERDGVAPDSRDGGVIRPATGKGGNGNADDMAGADEAVRIGLADGAAQMKQRLMELYFSHGADLTERDVLVRAAVAGGFEEGKARERLASELDVQAVTDDALAASHAGVEGVPCFIFGAVLAVAGAQSPDYLAGALTRAYAQFQQRLAAGQIVNPEARPY
ncbi:MAG: DsbA family oxidoreductase [Xanthobacteraceae bacterium]